MIKIQTGNWAETRIYNEGQCISVSATNPFDRKDTPRIRELAPSYNLLMDSKRGLCSEEEYCERFKKQLRKLDPKRILELIKEKSKGRDCVLLCYEKKNEFCHRQLVAGWLELKLGIKIDELKRIDTKRKNGRIIE